MGSLLEVRTFQNEIIASIHSVGINLMTALILWCTVKKALCSTVPKLVEKKLRIFEGVVHSIDIKAGKSLDN